MSKRASASSGGRLNDPMDSFSVVNEKSTMNYTNMTVVQLKEQLKVRGLAQKGLKRDLIQRLQQSDSLASSLSPDVRMSADVRAREKRKSEGGVNGDSGSMAPARPPASLAERRELQKERNGIVLWRRPLTTLYYFLRELLMLAYEFTLKLWHNKKVVAGCLLAFLSLVIVYNIDGPHQALVKVLRKEFLWCAYWVVLGIMSSVGLGTGLHTFLLYLGPHIAGVTLAAFECMSVDFPSPPYPDEIICPEVEGDSMSIWTIMSKVRLEAFMWGAGTAIGELPPYFVARASRLSGEKDEEELELEELEEKNPEDRSFLEKAKVGVHDLVQRVGFLGILLCASIPNPLFDLAGITCGHFLIPFWTFFGATLIGKAVIKMHIQKMFIIFMFSEHHVEVVVNLIKGIPYVGPSLQAPFVEYLQKQKEKLHVKPGTEVKASSPSWLSWVFEKVVLVMVAFFLVSIINSCAQNYHKRINDSSKKVAKE